MIDLQHRLIEYLKVNGPSTREILCKILKKPRTTVYDALKILETSSVVKRNEKGELRFKQGRQKVEWSLTRDHKKNWERMLLNGVNKRWFSSLLKALLTILSVYIEKFGFESINVAFLNDHLESSSIHEVSQAIKEKDIKKEIIEELHEMGGKYYIHDFKVINSLVQVILLILCPFQEVSLVEFVKKRDITESTLEKMMKRIKPIRLREEKRVKIF